MDNKSYQDHFFKKAKLQGYRSRSAFKLIELNKKFKFLRNGIKLLDVGSFPGGWCQVVSKKIKNGKILGIDKKKVENIKGIKRQRLITVIELPLPIRVKHRKIENISVTTYLNT